MLLDEIGKYLEDNGIGTRGTDIFFSYEPDEPDTLIVINETGGTRPQHVFSSSAPAWENPRIQVVCRSTDFTIARNKADDIYKILVNVKNQTLAPTSSASGALYFRIDAVQSPFSLPQDENKRRRVVCNYDVMKELST